VIFAGGKQEAGDSGLTYDTKRRRYEDTS